MGALVEQALPTLFGGVSKQPASVRRPEQVEAGDNALMSVVSGGFEKRPPTQTIAWLDFLDNTKEYAAHAIDRDATEQTFLLVHSSEIKAVNAITGAEITVSIGDSTRYYLVEKDGLDSTGIVQIDGANMSIQTQFDSGETQFDWEWELSDATTGRFKVEGSEDGSTWNDLQTGIGGAASGSFSTTIDAVATGDHNFIRVSITTGMAGADDTLTLKATFKDTTYLLGADADDFRFATIADNTFLCNRTVTTRMAEADGGSIVGTHQTFSDLPAAGASGDVRRIIGNDVDGFGGYYVRDVNSTWREAVAPDAHNNIDASSMPHRIIRNADGTFTFAAASWAARAAGDEDITEQPSFIDKKVQDLTFYRNRLTFIADEEVFTSQAGDVLDFWPEKAVEVLDSDPVSRAATTTDINILKFVTVFRKILFATSQRAQFEMTSDGELTPESAEFDLATSYAASPIAKPTTMGDVLYFPSEGTEHATFYEYFFDEASLSNTAADISKHVVDYVPNSILSIATDSTTTTMFALSSGLQNGVFVYRTFFDGNEKLQSSWSRYLFGASESAAFIHGMEVLSGFLVMIIERQDGGIYLEQMPIEREEQDSTLGFTPFIDQREVLTGSYDSTNDVTTWTTTWEHTDDAQIILGPSFSEPGRELAALYPDKYLLSLASVAAGETITINSVEFTAHASTTTVANREFDISGSDTDDAGELTTVINDATFGVSGVTATDNADGTITLNVDDAADGTISAPTGTAITNATITAVEVDDLVAAREDHSANQVWVGRPYELSVTLSEQFFREAQNNNAAIITGRLQLRDITFNLVDTGYLKVTITPEARDPYVYTFEGKVIGSSTTQIGQASIEDQVQFKVPVWSRSDKVDIVVSNDQAQPSIVASAAWRGFFNEITRQE